MNVCCMGNTTSEYNCDSTYEITGYYIERYVKEEVLSYYKNEELKAEGKSYESIIDFNVNSYFIQAEQNEISLADTVINWDLFNKSDVYYLPNSLKTTKYLKKFCPSKSDQVEIVNLSSQYNCLYYELKISDKYLYKIYFLRGNEIIAEIENNELNKIKLDLSDEIDSKAKTFRAHFIYSITKLECDYEQTGFKKWEYKK